MPRKFEALTVRELDARAEAFEALVVKGMHEVVRKSVARADDDGVIIAARDDGADPFWFLAYIKQLWSAFVGERLIPFLDRSMRATGSEQFRGFEANLFAGVSASNRQHALVTQRVDQPLETERYLRQAPNRLARIGDDLWDDARRELVAGIDAGESIDDLAKRVMRSVDVAEPRARTIARTESNGAMNSVVNDTNHYVDSLFDDVSDGIMKEWSATHDMRTRPSHVEADGQVVGLDDPFTVGQASLQFPSDPTGPPGETINCRCTTLTVLSDELIRAAGGEPGEDEDEPLVAATLVENDVNAFHLPGKHDQKRHGNRYKGGVQVKGIDKAGNPVKLPGPDSAATPKKSTKAKATKSAPKKTPTTDSKPKPAETTQPKQEEPTPQVKPTTVAKSDDEYRKVSYDKVVSEYEEKLGEVKPYQADALAYYTGNGYRTMQKGLREAKGDPAKMPMGVGAYTRHINQLMDQAGPSTDRYELYRGVGDISIALGTSKPQPGMRFGDYGFGSTSFDHGSARGFAMGEKKGSNHVIMYIDAPPGTRMIPVRAVKTSKGLTVGYADEKEMLLPNGVEYEVTKFVETEGGAPNKLYVRITGNDYVMTAAATSFEEDYDRRLKENGDETKGSPVFYVISSPPLDDDDVDEDDDDEVVIASNTENGVTMADDTDVEEETVVDDTRYASWSGVIALEGVPTGDGRQFEHNSLTWGDLPQPLGWMYERSHGGMPTDKVVNVGLIDTIERGEGGLIVATGRIDLRTERGWEVASLMGTREDPGSLAGISIDADDPDDPMGMDVEYRYADGCEVDDAGTLADDNDGEEVDEMKCMMPTLMVFHSGRIRAATMVDIPAFMEARIYLDQPLDDGDEGELHDVVSVEDSADDVVIASAYTMTLTDLPPVEWFTEPLNEPDIGAITVTDEGRIFGYLAPANVAHRGRHDKRVTVPMGNVDYGIWMNRVTIADDGHGGFTRLATGPITMNCGHAPSSNRVTGAARTQHYDNSCSVVATACVGENRNGVWIAGAVLPDVTADQVRRMMTLQLSGDWGPHREKPGKRELAGALLVPVPGFPRRSFSSVNVKHGMLQHASVPLRFAVTESRDDTRIFGARAAANRIAASVGRDRLSRARELAAKVRGL